MRGSAPRFFDNTGTPLADLTEHAPAVVTAPAMPLTFSIANGIAFGFITYGAVKLLACRPREAGLGAMVLAILFIGKFAIL
jgi:AGZA family xanthine/uracil permease-like MFS transporter